MTEPEKNDAAEDKTADAPQKVTEPIAELETKPKGAAPLKSTRKAVAAHKLVILGVLVTLLIAVGSLIFLRKAQNSDSQSMADKGFGPAGYDTDTVTYGTPQPPEITADRPLSSPKKGGPLKPFAKGEMAGLMTYASPQKAETITFYDRNKKPLLLSQYKGQVVVLNVWATWCAPCRHEMPTLANLAKTYGDKNLKVIALSVDVEGDFPKVISFMDVMSPLEVFTDPNFAAPKAFGIEGMPVTLILNKKGEIVARIDGVAKWDTGESYALMDRLLSE